MNELEREAILLTAKLAAMENWSPTYSQTPEQHAQLIKAEARLEITLVKFFRNMQKKVDDFVNWDNYNFQVRLDYNIDVIVNDDQIDDNDGTFIKVSLEPVDMAVGAGYAAGSVYSGIVTGVPSTDAQIQALSTDRVAALVGKRVLDDGSIVDNPNAEYNIMDTVRNDIVQAVKTSLGLGETRDEAVARMAKVIGPTQRAAIIARTESVNAYQAGMMLFGKQTGAKGKQWYDAGAKDICALNTEAGPIPYNQAYPGGVMQPTQHPYCRCGQRLIYAEEWANLKN